MIVLTFRIICCRRGDRKAPRDALGSATGHLVVNTSQDINAGSKGSPPTLFPHFAVYSISILQEQYSNPGNFLNPKIQIHIWDYPLILLGWNQITSPKGTELGASFTKMGYPTTKYLRCKEKPTARKS